MEIAVVDVPPESVEADLLAFPVTEPAVLGSVGASLDSLLAGRLAHLAEDRDVKGQVGHLALVHTLGELAAHRLAAAGVGRGADLDPDAFRTAASRVAQRAGNLRGGTVAWALDGGLRLGAGEQARAIVDGTVLGSYDPGHWKTKESERAPIGRLVLCGDGAASVAETASRAGAVARWANRCRELVDAPANELTPAALAERATSIASSSGLSAEIWGPAEIKAARMGAFAAVAQGSEAEPRLIVLRYEPDGAPKDVLLGLVGKAITFDTGGISIKPAEGMDRMKDDMAGGAAVIGAMRAISLLQAPIKVIGIVPASENMPGGRATKPGDVLTGAGGKTVEVLNTDAEGRLILGDGLWYAQRLGATHLVDVATLTGACVVALGKVASGLFGRPDAWIDAVRRASVRAGDRAWPLPIYDEYTEQLRSEIADLVNTGGRPAGACTAAVFLKEFAGSVPWAHLDIAGTAWADEPKPWQPKGPTGVAVRTLAELAFSSGEWA
jgi:leucyl aminopeptidase